jgi:hypothetical protein
MSSSRIYEEYRTLSKGVSANALLAHAWLDWGTKHDKEYIIVAADLLKEYGEEAIAALLKYKDRPEMEYFMITIAGLKGVAKSQREAALKTFLDHPKAAIADAAYEAIDYLYDQKTDVL